MSHSSLKAAAEDKEYDDIKKSLPTFNVRPAAIVVVPGFNGRPIDRDHVETLKQAWRSGKSAGYNPLPEMTLRMVGGVPTLIDGEHRLTAYLELIAEGEPIERVPCKEFKGNEKQAMLYMLGANSGMGWTMPQLGAKYAEAVNMYGLSYGEVAAVRGKSVQHIKDCIRLTEQPESIREAISDGHIAPAQALKLVKQQGSEEAAKTIKAASKAISEGVKAPKGKITQKVIDGLGDSKVVELLARGKEAKAHLSTMLESPAFDRSTKEAIRKVIKATGEPLPSPRDQVGEFLLTMAENCNDLVSDAAKLLIKASSGQFIPSNATEESKNYGHMTWLADMADSHRNPVRVAAAHWFMAVLSQTRKDREIAPPPSIMALSDAIQAEIDSGAAVNAESMCPEHMGLIGYLRTGRVA